MAEDAASTSSLASSLCSSAHRFCIEGDAQALTSLLTDCNGDLQAVLSATDPDGRLPIHNALLHANVACVREIIRRDAEIPDYSGFPPMHLSLALSGFEAYKSDCEACLSVLIDAASLDYSRTDPLGRTLLHVVSAGNLTESLLKVMHKPGVDWKKTDRGGLTAVHSAIDHDSADCLSELLQEIGSEALELRDSRGDTILHRASRRGMWKCLRILIETFTESVLSLANSAGKSAKSVAIESGFEAEFTEVLSGHIPNCHWKNQTVVVTHQVCRRHAELPPAYADFSGLMSYQVSIQPENPARLSVLLSQPHGALLIDEFADNLLWIWEPTPANIADILRVHEYSYVRHIREECEKLNPALGAVAYDRDTMISALSYQSSLYAAGSVIAAIEEVVSGRCRNAFCPIRPPGHHIGPMGKVECGDKEDMGSTGFCLLNNVAIGAAYAIAMLRKTIKRVAIIDFDVHHGNGTQAIIGNLLPTKYRAETQKYGLKATTLAYSYKPWLSDSDHSNVLLVSSHGYGGKFYPGSGTDSTSTESSPGGVLNLPFTPHTSSSDFRRLYSTVAFPRVLSFAPDLILISAGFDAHEKEDINDGFCQLCESDYTWLTEEIVRLANTTCSGRIVSVLEGGYMVTEGLISPFAMSVSAHVRALMTATREKLTISLKRKLSEDMKHTKRPKLEGNSPARD